MIGMLSIHLANSSAGFLSVRFADEICFCRISNCDIDSKTLDFSIGMNSCKIFSVEY